MRKPILKNHKKTYGRGKTPPLSAEIVDTPLDVTVGAQPLQTVTTARLDKAETIELAKRTLQSICLSHTSPSNAQASAARTLLELVGAIGRHADPTSMNTLPASEMSLEQLEAKIASLVSH